ncbi:hypothetical protein [Kordiimonas sp.]|uniref:hypothetical protein n=1 Tax=Kordiimonas sp. TaxID=1970157 RepID=UPI003A91C5AE
MTTKNANWLSEHDFTASIGGAAVEVQRVSLNIAYPGERQSPYLATEDYSWRMPEPAELSIAFMLIGDADEDIASGNHKIADVVLSRNGQVIRPEIVRKYSVDTGRIKFQRVADTRRGGGATIVFSSAVWRQCFGCVAVLSESEFTAIVEACDV